MKEVLNPVPPFVGVPVEFCGEALVGFGRDDRHDPRLRQCFAQPVRVEGAVSEELAADRLIRFFMTAGQVSDYTGAAALLGSLPKAEWLLADRGYDADWFRDALKDRGIRPCIPSRKSRAKPNKPDKRRYKRRNRIEIMLQRLKDWRRVATLRQGSGPGRWGCNCAMHCWVAGLYDLTSTLILIGCGWVCDARPCGGSAKAANCTFAKGRLPCHILPLLRDMSLL